jgi:hypothetical protein
MSADNGVYVLRTFSKLVREGAAVRYVEDKFPVWRVAHTRAIDNFNHFQHNQPENIGAYMVDVWGKSEIFTDEGKALKAAHSLADSIEEESILEYGVTVINTDYTFYQD